MRVREVLFSTSLREIDLARWCANHLTGQGEDKFYLRWNPDTRDYAVPVYKAQDLKNIRNNDGLMVVRLASRDFSSPAPRGPRRDGVPSPPRPAIEAVAVDALGHRTALEAKPGVAPLASPGRTGAHGLGNSLPIHFATANSRLSSPA
jgi:hypothetical protein